MGANLFYFPKAGLRSFWFRPFLVIFNMAPARLSLKKEGNMLFVGLLETGLCSMGEV